MPKKDWSKDNRSKEERIREAKAHHKNRRQTREDSIACDNQHKNLSPAERIELLDYRLGKDAGAKKERKRLMKEKSDERS